MTALLTIDLLFPNLNKLDFKGTELLHSTFSKIFTENEKFNNLTALPNPNSAEEAELYINCLDYLKDRITGIELFDDDSDRSLYPNLYNQLDNYPKLKKLVIHVPSSNEEYLYDLIMHYLKTTLGSNLNSLQHISIVSTDNSSYFNLLFTTKRDALLIKKKAEAVYIDIFSEISEIPSEEFMLFIMDKFPGLKTFEWLEKNNQIELQYSVPSESLSATLLLFLNSIMKIPNCPIPDIIVDHNSAIKLVEDLYADAEKNSLIPPLSRALRVVVYYFGTYYDIGGEATSRNNYLRCSANYSFFFGRTFTLGTESHLQTEVDLGGIEGHLELQSNILYLQ